MSSANLDVVKLLELVMAGVSNVNARFNEGRQMDNRIIDLFVSFSESSYRLDKYKEKIAMLDEDDAKMAITLLRPVQIRMHKANKLFIYYADADLNGNIEYNSNTPHFVKRTEWEKDRTYLTTMATDVVEYTDKFIEFVDDLLYVQEDVPWEDDFKLGCLIPFLQNMNFSGREEILEYMSSLLNETSGRTYIILEGIGGIGKSQIALEYAFRCAKKDIYDSILWIDAHDEQSLRSSIRDAMEKIVAYYISKIETDDYAKIGKKFGMPWLVDNEGKLKINNDSRGILVGVMDWAFGIKEDKYYDDILPKAIHYWFANPKNKNWLIIVDNMNDPNFNYKTLKETFRFPSCDWGKVIITSRSKGSNFFARSIGTCIKVDDPGIDTGVELLLKASDQMKSDLSADELSAAKGISQMLNNYPMALEIVGANISANLSSFTKYKEKLEQDDQFLFQKNLIGQKDAIDLTFLVPYKSLSANAWHVLNLFSFFHNLNITKPLVQKHGGKFIGWLEDESLYDNAVHELQIYSLAYITSNSEDKTLILMVHPVIHRWIRSRLDETQTLLYGRIAVMIISEILSTGDPTTERRYWISIYPHIVAVLKVADEIFSETWDEELLHGLGKIATCLAQLCLYHQASIIFEKLLNRYRIIYEYETNNINTIKAEEGLASSYYFLGRYTEALELYKKALKGREHNSGIHDPASLAVQRYLGSLYKNLGNYEQSLMLLQDVVARSTLHLGDSHLETITDRKTLGLLYKDIGNYKDAMTLLTESLESYRLVSGDDNPDTIDTLLSLGELYIILGEYKKSYTLLIKANSMFEELYGEEHPATLKAIECLGMLEWRLGEYEEAKTRLEKTLTYQKKIFGDGHPKVLKIIGDLGSIYQSLGDYKRSLELSLQAINGYEDSLGETHTKTLHCVLVAGISYHRLEEFDKAMIMLQRALKGLENIPQSTDLAFAMLNIGKIYLIRSEYMRAEELLKRAHYEFNRLFNKTHPNTLAALITLGTLYNEMGHTRKALKLFTEALDGYEDSTSSRLPNVSTIFENIGQAYLKQSEYNSALKSLKQALTNREKYLGDKHPTTLRIIKDIGFTYWRRGDYDTAKKFLERSLEGFDSLGYKNSAKLDSLSGIGLVYTELKQPKRAMEYFQKSVKGYEELFGPNHPNTVSVIDNMGMAFDKVKDYDEALKHYKSALMRCNRFKVNQFILPLTINYHIAGVYVHQRRYKEAKQLLEGVITGYADKLTENLLDIFKIKERLGVVYSRLGQYTKAVILLDESCKGYESLLGERKPDTLRVKKEIKSLKRLKKIETIKNFFVFSHRT